MAGAGTIRGAGTAGAGAVALAGVVALAGAGAAASVGVGTTLSYGTAAGAGEAVAGVGTEGSIEVTTIETTHITVHDAVLPEILSHRALYEAVQMYFETVAPHLA